jgi:hypothetical protein
MTPNPSPAASVLPGNSASMTKMVIGEPFLQVSDTPSPAGIVRPTPTGTPPSGPRPSVKPKNLKIVGKTQETVSLFWTDPTNTRWQVSYRAVTGGVWINVPVTRKPTSTRPFVVPGLYPGSNFEFQVAGVSATGKRGPFGPIVRGRTKPGNPSGIFNVFARFNLADKQLHIRWKNGKTPFTSMSATVSCGGTTATFTINAGARPNFPIRRLPQAKGCSVRLAPTYGASQGPVYTQMFDTQ